MSSAFMLGLVLLAVYGLTSLLLAAVVVVAWHGGLRGKPVAPGDLLALRLLPAAGGALLVLTVVLPAFLIYEPAHEREQVGPLLVAMALFSLVAIGDGIRRAWGSCIAARSLLSDLGPADCWQVEPGRNVDIVDVEAPIVAVVGGWRPRIVAAKRVVAACSQEEFCRVIAHEAAHVSARDNLKLLLLAASPDALAWMPVGTTVANRWRIAAEFAADERATGPDPRKRVALASALIKVARLSTAGDRDLPALSMPVGVDDVEGRVRRLLSTPSPSYQTSAIKYLVACAGLIPMLAVPLYRVLHQLLEVLVAFGR